MSKDGTLTVAKKADLVVMNLRAGNVDTADLHIGPLIVRGLARVENPTRIEATIQSNSKPVESTETRRNHGMNSLRSISKERRISIGLVGARLPKCRTREDERAKAQEPEWSGKMTFKI